ncbi:MAG TPA: hypothetical protein VKB71_09800 [Rhizomicrobium sp.]|nr:hypothetical protein [Rhizomicrobium sp.]
MADRASYGERADLSHHETFLRHARLRWLRVAVLIDLLAIGAFWWVFSARNFHLQHAGGTWLGYTLGTIGALIMLWLTTIGIRKRAMTSGHWSLKAWVSAHVYLGLSLVIIVTLHTGFQFGWNIHSVAYFIMLAVIGSGILGVIAYMYLPIQLSQARGDLTKKQMIEIIHSLDRRILDAAQPLDRSQAQAVQLSLNKTIIIGSLMQRLMNSYGGCGNRKAIQKMKGLQKKASGAQAEALEKIAGLLARKQEILTTARRYARVRAMLEVWLYIHVPMTFALLAAVTAHIVSVFFF